MTMIVLRALGLSLVVALAGCVDETHVSWEQISSFRIRVTSGALGTAEAPVDPLPGGTPFDIHVQAINGYGDPMLWDGTLAVSVVPGQLDDASDTDVEVVGGGGRARIVVGQVFGPTRVWFEDVGTEAEPGTLATGVTDAIWFRELRIRDIQESDSTVRSPFEGERPTVRAGRMVVTRVSSDGFYVTDTDTKTDAKQDKAWNSIFAFNYSVPEGLERGDLITSLTGAVSEFFGLTELSFPEWEVGGHTDVPEPIVLDCDEDLGGETIDMEPWESSLVEVQSAFVEVCRDYPDCPDYAGYGQWNIRLPCGERLNVISRVDVPSFDAPKNRGQTLTWLRGVLRQHRYASPMWIVEPRDGADICCPSCDPAMNEGC